MELDIQVPAIYPKDCKIVFVGDMPEKEDVNAKAGFIGAAERCLQRAASTAGLVWSECGRSNVAKRRPPGNKFRECFYETIEEASYTPTGKLSKRTKRITRSTQELLEWINTLQLELETQRPNLIVACGNETLEIITGLQGITNYRGSIVSDKWDCEFKVLAVEHTRYILGDPLSFWILAHDLKKAKREMEFPQIKRETWIEHSNPEHWLSGIKAAFNYLRLNPGVKWTLDVETRAGTLACFSIGYRFENGNLHTDCVPIQTTTGPYWSPQEEMEIWNALRATTLANPNLCNQNIPYDIYYLLRYGVEPSGVWMDTMLAHSILYPEFPKGLDFLCSFYLDDVVYYKGEGRNWNAGDRDPQLWAYCCLDAVYTLMIVEKIDEELKRRGMFEMYHGKTL